MYVDRFGWYSHRVDKNMEYIRFGADGTPVVVFPTSGGDHYEFSQRGMIDPIATKIDAGFVQVFCIDTNNWESWYNDHIHPSDRVRRAKQFEEFFLHELIPHLRHTTGTDRLILLGASFGGYHAITYALKHPELVNKAISLSGSFNIKSFLDGYYDNDCYFNNPVDFLPNISDPWFFEQMNTKTELVLVSSEQDNCLDRNVELANILTAKNIRHQFIVWKGNYPHDWPTWQQMLPHYI